jgi:hypothetical protein
MNSLNVKRVSKKFHEMFDSKIDLSDVKSDSNCFETRALAALVLMIKCGVNEEQAASNVTDGYHDLGLDAIYLDETQKTLFLVQSKWRNDGAGSISQEEMNTFVSGIKRILTFEIEGANKKIIDKKEEIEKALDGIGYKIEAVFVHTGNGSVNDFIMRPMEELIDATNDDAGDILHFSQIPYKEVYDYLAADGVTENIILDDVILNNWGKVEEPYAAYYGMVSASAIGEWYRIHGNKLFAQNLRFYKGRTDVNAGIKDVLYKEPQNFVYYNNGIKILCKKITRKAKNSTTNTTGIFTLEGVSLINGAQTAGSIGSVFLEEPEKLEKAIVMVQMIDMSEMSEDISKSITKLSNTQNRIENKDFAAQDPTQEKIKRELSFAHYQYLYKTGDEISDYSKQISFDEAIIALACMHSDVTYANIAKRNVGGLSDDITKRPYKELFNAGTNAFALLNSVLVVREVEKILQSKKAIAIGRSYSTCVHGNRLIEHLVLQKIMKEQYFFESVIDIGNVKVKIENLITKIVPIITKELDTTYVDSYPANVFKNLSKNKDIVEVVNSALSV